MKIPIMVILVISLLCCKKTQKTFDAKNDRCQAFREANYIRFKIFAKTFHLARPLGESKSCYTEGLEIYEPNTPNHRKYLYSSDDYHELVAGLNKGIADCCQPNDIRFQVSWLKDGEFSEGGLALNDNLIPKLTTYMKVYYSQEYRIKAGDTLELILEKNEISKKHLPELFELNPWLSRGHSTCRNSQPGCWLPIGSTIYIPRGN